MGGVPFRIPPSIWSFRAVDATLEPRPAAVFPHALVALHQRAAL
eukprot:CAMPEP_0198504910 /NCGR_PEP_ID=MMETSP1462-20131121/10741_1 /TAXON_ID=1333877 /ORGANISM="Brandtodinium nutriculum, Strain RCC3387" /LENGTH=43 /DNA_ID= /DNA_START= /DNA_END= /DNA_ORIENTATION=